MHLFSHARRIKDILLSAHKSLWTHYLHVSRTFNAGKALNDMITAEHRWAERVYNGQDILTKSITVSHLSSEW